MYTPGPFKENSPAVLANFIEHNSFATLTTWAENGFTASHIPLIHQNDGSEYGCLMGHVARANTQWKQFSSNKEVLAVFMGAHGYISPSWYKEKMAVPTWNYMAVHVYGIPTLIEDASQAFEVLKKTVSKYEGNFSQPWEPNLPADYLENLVQAIVAFRIPISRIEGRFKLSQNRSNADRLSVIAVLEKGEPSQVKLAQVMKETL